MLKNILLVTPLNLLGRAGVFLIYVVLANWFGDTAEMDFIYYYWGIAVFLIGLLSSASAYSVLVPLLAEAREKGVTAAQLCVQSIFHRYIRMMPWGCGLLVATTWGISQLFFPNAGLTLTTIFGIVVGFYIFTVIASIRWMLKAVLDTYHVFHFPLIVQCLSSILVITIIFLSKEYISWYSIPLALIIGELFQTIVLLFRCGVVLELPFYNLFYLPKKVRDTDTIAYATQFLRQTLMMMGAAISDGLNPVVDRGMASSLGPGSVSKLDYALRLGAIPETLTSGAMPVLLSHWAKVFSSKDETQLKQSVWRGVAVVIVLMVPLLVGLYIFRTNIVRIFYGHGKLSLDGQLHIASLFGIFLIGTLPRLISRLLIRAHLASQNHNKVVTATLIRLVFNPICNWLFMRYWGLEGIAWSTTILSYPILAYIAVEFWRNAKPAKNTQDG
ncbi:hypothetical protein JT359_00200 [Candidatus Poribacteria bacterium]|nr:hypothetical protein [Candidatus Poribacteria bacterium]